MSVTDPSMPPPSRGKPNWWNWRRWGMNFLTLSILAHLIFLGLAAKFIVQIFTPRQPFTPAAAARGSSVLSHAVEHKVALARKKFSSGAPVAAKRVTTTSMSKVALPAMPALPAMNSPIVPLTAVSGMGGTGVSGAGFGGSGGGGGGSGGGGGGMNLFGLPSSGAGLAGTLYDLKQTPTRQSTNMTPDRYGDILTQFANGGFNMGLLSGFFSDAKPLYATQIWIPNIPADQGPAAFHLQNVIKPNMWLVHYKGQVIAPATFTFHFVGAGDDLMMVRFDNRLVLDRDWYIRPNWRPQANYDYGFSRIENGFAKGDAIQVEAGKTYPIEIVIGEQPGGETFATLLQEIEGEKYDKDAKGNPILPVFRMSNAKPAPSTQARPYPPHRDDGPVWKAQPAGGPGGLPPL